MASTLLGGCIPVWRSTLLRPNGAVVVRDAQSDAPIEHARVVVRRYNLGPPPQRKSHQYIDYTATDGRVRFAPLSGHEWVMPLMMHGVPQWAFDVCVDAPGYHGQTVGWLIQGMWTEDKDRDPRPDLQVKLRAGEGDCDTTLELQDFRSDI